MEIDISMMEATMDAIGAEMNNYPLPRAPRPKLRRIRLACPNVVWADGEHYRCGTRIGHADEQELVLCHTCQDFVQGMA
jgi:hypothetical protein